MKTKATYFLAGILSVVLVLGVSMTALATNDLLTITIHPIQIMVNGETFHPKDAQGKEVLTFSVNGTSYAPVRALAEAYGLEVGYDSKTNTATVNGPAKQSQVPASTNDFTSQWEIKEKPVTHYGSEKIFTATYSGSLGMSDFKTWWKSFDTAEIKRKAEALAAEAQALSPECSVTMYFSYGSYNLGTVWAFGDLEQSDFRPASVWIK